jgi:hypothetical protein
MITENSSAYAKEKRKNGVIVVVVVRLFNVKWKMSWYMESQVIRSCQ